jgi:hypothetical protein
LVLFSEVPTNSANRPGTSVALLRNVPYFNGTPPQRV